MDDHSDPDDPHPLPGLLKTALIYLAAAVVSVAFLIGLTSAFF